MSKKVFVVFAVLIVLLMTASAATAKVGDTCVTIISGQLFNSSGDVLTLGYDEWGYNYQAHLFNGYYCDAYRDAAWCQEYADIKLVMKWNDAWMSNKDCDGDGLLDRHYGFDSYIGSGAWETNLQTGEYEGEDGQMCIWTYFTKIIAAPADAYQEGDYWYAADGTEIGPVLWNEFATVIEIYNDPCAGLQGPEYISPDHAGFGGW